MSTTAAFFVSHHGFGHAARSSAVMEQLNRMLPSVKIIVFSTSPRWFFERSLGFPIDYIGEETDVGLVQKSPLEEDLEKTLQRLDDFYPLHQEAIDRCVSILQEAACNVVICDIAPMGVEVAANLGIPSVLIENFTWDWIYEGYTNGYAEPFSRHVHYLKTLFSKADLHLTTKPYCSVSDSGTIINPISRLPKSDPAHLRARLGLNPEEKLVVITMGGIQDTRASEDNLKERRDVRFLIPGSGSEVEVEGNLIRLPFESDYYHPDIIAACDAIICKSGYSTLAEAFWAGVPVGYISRDEFRESEKLEDFIKSEMHGLKIAREEYRSGRWIVHLDELLSLPKLNRAEPRGALQAAENIMQLLGNL